MATTIVPCVCGGCCCAPHQQQAASVSGSSAVSSCGRSVSGVTAVCAMPSAVAAAEAAASVRSTAPRRPLVVDWQLQHSSQGGMLVCGFVYECTGFKVLPPAMLSGGVLLTSDGEEYDLLHPCYDLRTGTIATSPGCATDAEAPPMLRSPRRGRRNVPASSRLRRSSSDNEKMAATVDGRVAHSCSRCTHVDQAGPCSFAPVTTAGCAAAAATTASGGVAAVCTSGIGTGCRFDDDKRIARLCATVSCPAQPCLSSTPTTVHCLQRLPPVAGPSSTTAAASERSLPLLRPPTPFGDGSPTDVHVVVEAGARRDACALTAPSQRHLSDLTTAIRPSPPLPTVVTSGCRASAEHCPAGNRLRGRHAGNARATAASSVATMPVTENMQTARLCDCQPLSCKGRSAQYDRDPVAVTSVASDQTLSSPAVAANCNGCTAALSLLANWGINTVASRQITEPIQGETLAESSPQSNVSVASVLLPHVASVWPPRPRCTELLRSSAPLSSTAAQAAAAVGTTVYPCRAPAASTSTTAALRTTAAPHRTEWSSSSRVTATSAFTRAATSGRTLRSSDRRSDASDGHTDTSASTSGRTLRSAARRFDLSCTATSASASELPSFDPNFNWSSSRDGFASAASSSARRKRAGRETAGKEHPHDSGKRLRLKVAEAAPEPSKGGHHSRKCHRSSSRRVQVSSRVATRQSDAVLLVPTRTTGSRPTDQALASSHAHSHRVRGHCKVDPCARDARSSADSDDDDVARSVSSWRSRQHDRKRNRRRDAFSRSRSPSSLSRDGGADRLRSATRGSSGCARHRQGTALGSYEAATHVKDRCRASGDRRRCRDVSSVAESDAVRGRLRSDGTAAESCAPSSTDSGICLPAGGHRGLSSSGHSVARSDSRPLSAKRALEPPHATVPSASSSRKTREQPLRAAAAKRASNKEDCVNDPLRGRRPAGRTR